MPPLRGYQPGFVGTDRLQPLPDPNLSPDSIWSSGDATTIGFVGTLGRTAERLGSRVKHGYDPDFMPDIPQGFAQYASWYASAGSQEEADLLTRQIRELELARYRQSQRSFGSNLGGTLASEIFNPINLIPIPALRGLGFGKGALMGGTAFGTIVAGEEALISQSDPTRTPEESVMNIGGATILGGLLGGVVGKVTSRSATTPNARASTASTHRASSDIASFVQKVKGPESSNGADTFNEVSGAGGPHQFMPDTWRKLIKKYRPELAGRSDLQRLRWDNKLADEMAGRLTEEHGAALRKKGLKVDHGTLYVAHRTGPKYGVKILKADPNTPMSKLVPAKWLEQNPDMRGKTAGQWVAEQYTLIGGTAGTGVRATGAAAVDGAMDVADGDYRLTEVEVDGRMVRVEEVDLPDIPAVEVRVAEQREDFASASDAPPSRSREDVLDDLDRMSQGQDPDRYQALMDELNALDSSRGRPEQAMPAGPQVNQTRVASGMTGMDRDSANALKQQLLAQESWVPRRVAYLERMAATLERQLARRKERGLSSKGEKTQLKIIQKEAKHLRLRGSYAGLDPVMIFNARDVGPGRRQPVPVTEAMRNLVARQKSGVSEIDSLRGADKYVEAIDLVARLGIHGVSLTHLKRFAAALHADLASSRPAMRFSLPQGQRLSRKAVYDELLRRRTERLKREPVPDRVPEPSREPTAPEQTARDEQDLVQRQLDSIDEQEDRVLDVLERIREGKHLFIYEDGKWKPLARGDGREGGGTLTDVRSREQKNKWLTDENGYELLDENGYPMRNPRYVPRGHPSASRVITEDWAEAELLRLNRQRLWWEDAHVDPDRLLPFERREVSESYPTDADGNPVPMEVDAYGNPMGKRFDAADERADATELNPEYAEARLRNQHNAAQPWEEPWRDPVQGAAMRERAAKGLFRTRADSRGMEWELHGDPERGLAENEAMLDNPNFDPKREGWEEAIDRNLAAAERAQRDLEIEAMKDDWGLDGKQAASVYDQMVELETSGPAARYESSFDEQALPFVNDADTHLTNPAFTQRMIERGSQMVLDAKLEMQWLANNASGPWVRTLARHLAPLLEGVELRVVDEHGRYWGRDKHDLTFTVATSRGVFRDKPGGARMDGEDLVGTPSPRGEIWLNAQQKGANETTFIHEGIHAALIDRWGKMKAHFYGQHPNGHTPSMKSPPPEVRRLMEELEHLRKDAHAQLEKMSDEQLEALGISYKDRWLLQYGLGDPDEFITMSFAGGHALPKFLDALVYGVDSRTGWRKFKDWVLEVLGVKGKKKLETAFDRVLEKGAQLLDTVTPEGLARASDEVDGMGSRVDAGQALPRRPGPREAEGIQLNMRAIRDEWNSGRWEGVLEGETELRNFRLYVARQEHLAPDMPPEQVEELALRLVDNDREVHRVSRNGFENSVLVGLPYWQVERMAEGTDFMREILELNADYGVMTAANQKGVPTAPGGSVGQLVEMDRNKQRVFGAAFRRSLAKYLTGKERVTDFGNEVGLAVERSKDWMKKALDRQPDRLDYDGFGEAVMRVLDGHDDVRFPDGELRPIPEEAREAAAEFTKIMDYFQAEGKRVGYFAWTRDLDRQIRELEFDLARAGDDARAAANIERQIEELKAKKEADFKGGEDSFYRQRFFNHVAVENRADELREILARGYRTHRDYNYSPQAAYEAADSAIAKILADPDDIDMMPGAGAASHHRSLPVSNREISEFLINNPEIVMYKYALRTSGAIRMMERYGDPFALDYIDGMRQRLRDAGKDEKTVEKLIQLFEDQRDRVLGAFHGSNPMSWDNRAARVMRNYGNLTTMGSVITSQVSDPARALMAQGPTRFFQSLIARFADPLFNGLKKDELLSTLSGHSGDLALARPRAMMMEGDSGAQYVQGSFIERLLARAQVPFFILNLMGPFTVYIKDLLSIGAGDQIMRRAIDVAEAIKRGEEPPAKELARLAASGIDLYGAQLIASMPWERSTTGSLIHPNVKVWAGPEGDQARRLLLAAVNGELGRSVITPGGLDKPAITDGVAHNLKGRLAQLETVKEARARVSAAQGRILDLREGRAPDAAVREAEFELKEAQADLTIQRRKVGEKGRREVPIASLPFQLKSFVISSAPKTLHSLLSGRDRAAAAGVLSMMAAGWVAAWMKAGAAWDYMELDEKAQFAMSYSGLVGWFADPIEGAANVAGLTERGEQQTTAESWGNFIGPAPARVAGVIEALFGDIEERKRLAHIRKGLPLNNMIYWDHISKDLFAEAQVERAGTPAPSTPWVPPAPRGSGVNPYPMLQPRLSDELDDEMEPPAPVAPPSEDDVIAAVTADWKARFGKKKKKKKRSKAKAKLDLINSVN